MPLSSGVKASLAGSQSSAKRWWVRRSPASPPTSRTRPSGSNVALWKARTWCMRAGSRRQRSLCGSHSSALLRATPPQTSTRPSFSKVMLWPLRACARRPASTTLPRCRSMTSAVGGLSSEVMPPVTRMRPSARRSAAIEARPLAREPMRVSRRVAASKRSTASDSVDRPRSPPMTITLPSAALTAAWWDTASVPTRVTASGGGLGDRLLPPPPQPASVIVGSDRALRKWRRCMGSSGRTRCGAAKAEAADSRTPLPPAEMPNGQYLFGIVLEPASGPPP
jgi:hypothetical protein